MKNIFNRSALIIMLGSAAFTAHAQSAQKPSATPTPSVEIDGKPSPPKEMEPEFPVGSLVEAQDKRGKWYSSRIEGFNDGKYRVHYFGWSSGWDEWVAPSGVRVNETPDLGREVEVEQNGTWFPAMIVDFKFNEYLVVYRGGVEDEWVKPERVRDVNSDDWVRGKQVEALWNGKWIAAQILDTRPGEIYLHYEGYSDRMNAWVPRREVRRIR